MGIAGVAHCQCCNAVVNVTWSTCLACQRPTPPSSSEWLGAWRQLADLVHGITKEDARFTSVMNALDACDTAYLANNWGGFQSAAEQVRALSKAAREQS